MSTEQAKAAEPEVLPKGGVPAVKNQQVAKREEFGASEQELGIETASSALAAQAAAQVQARYVYAERHPRNFDLFRQNLLHECERTSFAEVAEYAKPVGDRKVKGASIRFVETALRHFKNVHVETPARFDSRTLRILACRVTDLEANVTVEQDVYVEKTVERSSPKPTADNPLGYISFRTNTQNKRTYLVEATEDDLLMKAGSLCSKAIRTAGLRVLPPDVVEEAIALCKKTLREESRKDPDAARKRILDGFAALHVPATAVTEYVGKEIATLSPAELEDLRLLWASIKEGETTWTDALAKKAAEAAPKEAASSATQKLADKLTEKTEPKAEEKPKDEAKK
ncbi:MAG: hypothetical protein M3167_06170 [Acidobacteriota bacterium]|nr:hypothetical protein [Acidobacteriota bacterium]MDQ6892250.1 hypothetical protein [Acidobacteriota bacterium]